MKYLLFTFFILTSLQSIAQSSSARKKAKRTNTPSFPTSFVGNWKGTMNWTPNNGKQGMEVPVQLIIQPIKDSAKQYTWNIIYGVDKKDNRPYVLKQIDTVKNHWVVDEQNGIVLSSYWLGGRFSGVFAVQGSVILDSYWLQGDELHFEFFSYPQKPTLQTGTNNTESGAVDVFRLGSYQKGVLKRVEKP